jgi:hypothetical protein
MAASARRHRDDRGAALPSNVQTTPVAQLGDDNSHDLGGPLGPVQGSSPRLRRTAARGCCLAGPGAAHDRAGTAASAAADPRLAKVTVAQLLTMTSGLAGDDGSLDGDFDLLLGLLQSRDWVRHILDRRLVTTPGTTFAYSNAGSHLLSAIVADATGQARWRSPAPSCSPHSASTPSTPSSRSTSTTRPGPRRRPTTGPRWPGTPTRRATRPAGPG